MNIGLETMIFCLRKEDITSSELNISTDIENCDLIPYTFYNIDFISISPDNPNYTIIGSSGYDFTCNERYDVIKHKIEQIRIMRYN